METIVADPEENKISPKRPRFSGISHLSIPCRDLEESKEFYAQVMGGELVHEIEGFFEVRIADVIVGLSERSEGWTGCDAEYPHYAFFVDAEDFPTVAWLRQSGVTTSEPWTRDGIKGLLYFRDPSGNLLEMYCPKIKEAANFARRKKQGGTYEIDCAALNYTWKRQKP